MTKNTLIPTKWITDNISPLEDVSPESDTDKKRYVDKLAQGALLLRDALFDEGSPLNIPFHIPADEIEYEITPDGRYKVTACPEEIKPVLAVLVWAHEKTLSKE